MEDGKSNALARRSIFDSLFSIFVFINQAAGASAGAAAGAAGLEPGFGRFTPYFERLTRRFSKPAASSRPRTMC
jgi:hypothetical protein